MRARASEQAGERTSAERERGRGSNKKSDNNATHNNRFSFSSWDSYMIFLTRKCNKSRSRHVERHDKHKHIISGTVASFSYSLADSVQLFRTRVSEPYFHSLVWISHKNFIVCFACHLSLLPETVFQREKLFFRHIKTRDGFTALTGWVKGRRRWRLVGRKTAK